jgi:IMP dehydrogenase
MYKEYRGMGSKAVLETGVSADRYLQKGIRPVAEGVEGLVPCKGPVEAITQSLASGIQIAMGYVGATTLTAFQERAAFVEITPAGMTESKPHSIVA